MNLAEFKPCPHCGKLNQIDQDRCAWCFTKLPSKGQEIFQAIVFFGSVIGILAAAYVAYRIGGWS